MSGQWKPGDVADLVYSFADGGRAIRVAADDCPEHHYSGDHWHFANGSHGIGNGAKEVRPLVVIDPEDAEAVARLRNALPAEWCLTEDAETRRETFKAVQQALREFANPTPPKPDEPQGLGAVVRDAQNELWIRTCYPCDDCLNKPWQRGPVHKNWQIVDAVEVLAEGYDQGAGEPLADWERDLLRGES